MEIKFTLKEKLNLALNFLKSYNSEHKVKYYSFYTYLVNLFDYNKPPQVVGDEEFKLLDMAIIYRGANLIDHHANLLCDYDYHYGYGINGYGVYATIDYDRAFRYARLTDDKILKFKFIGKLIDANKMVKLFGFFNELYKDVPLSKCFEDNNIDDDSDRVKLEDLAEYYNNLTTENDKNLFKKMLTLNKSILPLLLGYDAINGREYVIFNRGKIVVSKSEFDRITNASKIYQNGFIDFEKKCAEDYLME